MPYKSKAKLKAYNKKRDATPARRKARSMNVMARRIMTKALGKKAVKGKDVDHIIPITNGGTNSRSNLRVMSKTANRKRKSK